MKNKIKIPSNPYQKNFVDSYFSIRKKVRLIIFTEKKSQVNNFQLEKKFPSKIQNQNFLYIAHEKQNPIYNLDKIKKVCYTLNVGQKREIKNG